MWHVDALSILELRDFTFAKLPELPHRLCGVREQVGSVGRIFCDPDRPVVDAVVNPMG